MSGELPVLGQRPVERSDAARNRERILAAARRLVDERGGGQLTMNAVAAAAEVGVGTVYRRFGDQAGLVDALMNEREIALQQQLLTGPPPLGPGALPRDRIIAFLHAYADMLEAYAPVLATAGSAARNAQHGRGAGAFRHQHLALLIEQLSADRGRAPGHELDAHFLADALLAPLDPAAFLGQRDGLGYSLQRIKNGLSQLVDGIG
ncbi:TetR/AcrR family transcriptional regulator [Microlunatus soli]|uniref:DNA-binding transcriptional regulator, AcrR family n=1 Tax=Microlunatus soli TaxID=630515 RepID=A0A1H1TNT9_9ACTN|nr:TetR/AcrR family transcriptional regulator [Microlunatus soli]SDS61898.1 DNA-binding transcriptional regulator, AcrR family [Microlunatus soli]